MQRSQKTPDEEAGGEAEQEGDREADESVAALAGAQEAQQQAVQAGQEALAEEHQSLMQLRQELQQQSGQPSQHLVHTAYFVRHIARYFNAYLLLLHILTCSGKLLVRAHSLVLRPSKGKADSLCSLV